MNEVGSERNRATPPMGGRGCVHGPRDGECLITVVQSLTDSGLPLPFLFACPCSRPSLP